MITDFMKKQTLRCLKLHIIEKVLRLFTIYSGDKMEFSLIQAKPPADVTDFERS